MPYSLLIRIMIELSIEIDSYKDKGARRRLTEELNQKGIVDKQVLNALNTIPRHLFIHKDFRSHAYLDKAFPIGDGQTISQPYTVAFQTQILHIQKNDKVLEIGTGSGYQAAIIAEMGAQLTSIERHKGLHESAKKMLSQLGLEARLLLGDGSSDISKEFGPFDKIIVTAGAPKVPMSLANQLAIGGTMVIPIGTEKEQLMHSLIKKPNGEFEVIPLTKFRFVPLIGEQAW
jgi:protein-L-isoaspartate(D-aspartate) O-methyltransferase